MSEIKPPAAPARPNISPLAQQMSLLQLRITDLNAQIGSAMKAFADENVALRKENADLKTQLQTASPPVSSQQTSSQ